MSELLTCPQPSQPLTGKATNCLTPSPSFSRQRANGTQLFGKLKCILLDLKHLAVGFNSSIASVIVGSRVAATDMLDDHRSLQLLVGGRRGHSEI